MNSRGFTLVELFVTLAVAAIMATLAMMSFRLFLGTNTMITEMAKVTDALMQARNIANSRQECVVVTLTASTLDVVSYTPPAVTPPCSAGLAITQITVPTYHLSTGYTLSNFSTGTTTLTFNTIGGLVTPNVVTLTLSGPNNQVGNYKIYPAIGQIRVSGP